MLHPVPNVFIGILGPLMILAIARRFGMMRILRI